MNKHLENQQISNGVRDSTDDEIVISGMSGEIMFKN